MSEAQPHKRSSQDRALQILIDQSENIPRYRMNLQGSNGNQHKKRQHFQVWGKQNIANREKKELLPKLKNSKQELKRILRKLEEPSLYEERNTMQVSQKQSKTCSLNSNQNLPTRNLKSSLNKNRELLNKSKRKQTPKLFQKLTQSEDLKALIHQKNYSTNTLNVKTLNILQQLNSRSHKTSTLLHSRSRNLSSKNNKKMVAFLRKVS